MKYEKMIDNVLVKSDTEIDEVAARKQIDSIRNTNSTRSINNLILSHPIYSENDLNKMNNVLSDKTVKTVGDLIKALQTLPKDMPYMETWSGLYIDQSIGWTNPDTAQCGAILEATE
jgi:hypothetical protein